MLYRNQMQHYQLDDGKDGAAQPETANEPDETEEVVPGVSIVRSNTPRPHTFETMVTASGILQRAQQAETVPTFPMIAPSAPPLPEEVSSPLPEDLAEEDASGNPQRGASLAEQAVPEASEFVWAFEYGLEMDTDILNSPERLAGRAQLPTPAMLKGYSILLGAQHIHGVYGPTIVALVPSPDPNAEVWGVAYRVPAQVVTQVDSDPSLLDTIHAAIPPQKFFHAAPVVAHDIYHKREIECITYLATGVARQQLHLVPLEQWSGDASFVQRLVSIGRKQRLPDRYMRQYDELISELPATQVATMAPPVSSMPGLYPDSAANESITSTVRDEQNTEPLRALREQTLPVQTSSQNQAAEPALPASSQLWLTIFSTYLLTLLLATLVFAAWLGLTQGNIHVASILLFDVPWLVMMYGLLGGCVSSLVTLRTFSLANPPLFLVVTWFARPFVGAVLALFAYLLLTSGLFALGDTLQLHTAFFLLIGALAGLCEGWIFIRRNT